MKINKKSFDFLAFKVEVWLTDSAPKGFRDEALAGVFHHEANSPIFKIWFKKTVTTNSLVHECWHLFMTILSAMDCTPHYFDELNSEIYAYSFHSLTQNVLETATSMKAYSLYYYEEEKKEK